MIKINQAKRNNIIYLTFNNNIFEDVHSKYFINTKNTIIAILAPKGNYLN